ncbi:unnamed protein product, partial [Amoebophrya sp. A25]|eukprot:GSA25T00015744001.1
MQHDARCSGLVFKYYGDAGSGSGTFPQGRTKVRPGSMACPSPPLSAKTAPAATRLESPPAPAPLTLSGMGRVAITRSNLTTPAKSCFSRVKTTQTTALPTSLGSTPDAAFSTAPPVTTGQSLNFACRDFGGRVVQASNSAPSLQQIGCCVADSLKRTSENDEHKSTAPRRKIPHTVPRDSYLKGDVSPGVAEPYAQPSATTTPQSSDMYPVDLMKLPTKDDVVDKAQTTIGAILVRTNARIMERRRRLGVRHERRKTNRPEPEGGQCSPSSLMADKECQDEFVAALRTAITDLLVKHVRSDEKAIACSSSESVLQHYGGEDKALPHLSALAGLAMDALKQGLDPSLIRRKRMFIETQRPLTKKVLPWKEETQSFRIEKGLGIGEASAYKAKPMNIIFEDMLGFANAFEGWAVFDNARRTSDPYMKRWEGLRAAVGFDRFGRIPGPDDDLLPEAFGLIDNAECAPSSSVTGEEELRSHKMSKKKNCSGIRCPRTDFGDSILSLHAHASLMVRAQFNDGTLRRRIAEMALLWLRRSTEARARQKMDSRERLEGESAALSEKLDEIRLELRTQYGFSDESTHAVPLGNPTGFLPRIRNADHLLMASVLYKLCYDWVKDAMDAIHRGAWTWGSFKSAEMGKDFIPGCTVYMTTLLRAPFD